MRLAHILGEKWWGKLGEVWNESAQVAVYPGKRRLVDHVGGDEEVFRMLQLCLDDGRNGGVLDENDVIVYLDVENVRLNFVIRTRVVLVLKGNRLPPVLWDTCDTGIQP